MSVLALISILAGRRRRPRCWLPGLSPGSAAPTASAHPAVACVDASLDDAGAAAPCASVLRGDA